MVYEYSTYVRTVCHVCVCANDMLTCWTSSSLSYFSVVFCGHDVDIYSSDLHGMIMALLDCILKCSLMWTVSIHSLVGVEMGRTKERKRLLPSSRWGWRWWKVRGEGGVALGPSLPPSDYPLFTILCSLCDWQRREEGTVCSNVRKCRTVPHPLPRGQTGSGTPRTGNGVWTLAARINQKR